MSDDARPKAQAITIPREEYTGLQTAAGVLSNIADKWDTNGLDEDRPDWRRDGIGEHPAYENVELYSGRGGGRLLTLQQCFDARWVLGGKPAPDANGVYAKGMAYGTGLPRGHADDIVVKSGMPGGFPVTKVKDGEEWRGIDRMTWRDDGVLELEIAPRNDARKIENYRDMIAKFLTAIDPSSRLLPGSDYTFLFGNVTGELISALRTWPIFADGKPITPELVRLEGVAAASADADNLRMTDVVAALRKWPIFADTGIEITPERIKLVAESIADLEAHANANVDRLKACEVIANGEDGWEKLANECPSTAAVAGLRNCYETLFNAVKHATKTTAVDARDIIVLHTLVNGNGGSLIEAKIITEHVHPPIPVRIFDWSAVREGYDPESKDPIGWGATEEAAIAALKEAEDEQAFDPELPVTGGSL